MDKLAEIKNITKELIEKLGMTVKCEVVETATGEFSIQLETEEPGILIGYHGETIGALQLLLGIMVYRHLGEWVKIVVNIGDYRQRRQETLEGMAMRAAEQARLSGSLQNLPPMSSFERRIIHLALSSVEGIETISEGEGNFRHVVVKPK